jgi:diguanylate cyclase
VVAFCVSGIFFLLLLPDSARVEPQALAVATAGPAQAGEAAVAALPPDQEQTAASVELGRGGYGPLGGAGSLRRYARHLPIERDGKTHFLAVEQVVAVHANAHYTYVFDGNDKLFCPLAIGDVESRLDDRHFVRVHRSHIVNINRVVGYRRSGDNELVELAGTSQCVVPVSRSRIGSLKSRVANLNGADPALPRRRRLAVQ